MTQFSDQISYLHILTWDALVCEWLKSPVSKWAREWLRKPTSVWSGLTVIMYTILGMNVDENAMMNAWNVNTCSTRIIKRFLCNVLRTVTKSTSTLCFQISHIYSFQCLFTLRLIKMSLTKTYSRVWVGKNLSDMSPIRNGFKQGDALSPLLFNSALV